MDTFWAAASTSLRCWTRILRNVLVSLDGSPGSVMPSLEPCRDLQIPGVVARFASGLGFAVAWTLMYQGMTMCFRQWGIKRLQTSSEGASSDKFCREAACRTVCIVHGVVCCGLATLSNLVVGPWAYSAVGEPNTALQTLTLEVSWGYFVFDICWCLISGEEAMMIVHHAASLAACGLGLFLDASGSELVGSLFGAEITNPLLQIRWFMLEAKMKGTPRLLYVELAFAVSFLICRVLWAPSLLYVVLVSTKPHLSVKVGGSALQIISGIWAVEVAGRLVKGVKMLRSQGKTKKDQ